MVTFWSLYLTVGVCYFIWKWSLCGRAYLNPIAISFPAIVLFWFPIVMFSLAPAEKDRGHGGS